MQSDYYETLGVGRDASDREIKTAFRNLARELHPDVNNHDPQAEEKFKQAAEAYEVLSDAERRSTYDRFGHDGLRSGGWAPHSAFGSIEEIFNAFFGGDALFGFGRQGPAGGGDIGATLEIALAEVVSGTTREIRFDAVTTCDHCLGNGAEPGTPIRACDRCDGTGQLRQVSRSAFGQVVRAMPCDRCGGDGRIAETPCERCDGAGRVAGERAWEVEVPPGIESGQRIRIAGAGHAGDPGAGAGDLYVEVRVAADERFQREGRDLVSVVDVSATAAMLGTTLGVDTLDGERDLEVPAGSQPGEVLVLDGLGLPDLGGSSRGDQRVLLNVIVPSGLDSEQRALTEQLDQTLEEPNLSQQRDEGIFARLRRAGRAGQ
jgi:molecular chaperone DnaJ